MGRSSVAHERKSFQNHLGGVGGGGRGVKNGVKEGGQIAIKNSVCVREGGRGVESREGVDVEYCSIFPDVA